MFRFSTPVPPRLSIEVQAGTVDVDTSTTEETTVELTPLNDSKTTTDAIAEATVEQHGDAIVVHLPQKVGSLIGRGPRVAVRVATNDAAGLRVKTGSADVTARGTFGTTAIDTGSGDIEIGVVADSLRVNTGSGDVRIERVERDVAVKTGSGDVMLGTVRGEVSFSSGSGDLELVAGGRALVSKTGSGSVTVGTAPADVRITTASGDTRLDTVEAGEIHVKAASGDVQAAVRAGTAAWLDVHTVSGRIRSGLDMGDVPGAEDRTVQLHLSTVSGSIDVTRV